MNLLSFKMGCREEVVFNIHHVFFPPHQLSQNNISWLDLGVKAVTGAVKHFWISCEKWSVNTLFTRQWYLLQNIVGIARWQYQLTLLAPCVAFLHRGDFLSKLSHASSQSWLSVRENLVLFLAQAGLHVYLLFMVKTNIQHQG